MISLNRGRWLSFAILCNVASSFVNPSHPILQKPIPLHFRNKSELYIQITNKNLDEQFAAWDAEPDPEPLPQPQEQQPIKEESSVPVDAPIESFDTVEQSTSDSTNTYKEPFIAQFETSWAGTGDSATTRFNQRIESFSTKKMPIRDEPVMTESIVAEVPYVEEVIVDMEKENISSDVINKQTKSDEDDPDQTIDMIQRTDMDPPDVEEVIVDMVKENTSSDVIIELARSNETQDVSDQTIEEVQSEEIDPNNTEIDKEIEVQSNATELMENITQETTSEVYDIQEDSNTETLEKEVPMTVQESTKDKTFDEDIADEETIAVASNEVVTQDFVIEKLDQQDIQNESDILEVEDFLDAVTSTDDGDSDSSKEDDKISQVQTNDTDSTVEARTKVKSVEVSEEETIPFFANFGKVGKEVPTSSPKSTSKSRTPFFIEQEIVPQKKKKIQDQNTKIQVSGDELSEVKTFTNVRTEKNETTSKPKAFVTKPKTNKRKWSKKQAVPDEIDYLSPEEAADSVSSYLDMIEAQAMEKVKLLEEQNNADIKGLEAASSFLDSLKSLVTPDLKSLFKRSKDEFPLEQKSVGRESSGQSLPLEKPQVDTTQEITAIEERLQKIDQSSFSKQTADSNLEEINDDFVKDEANILDEESPTLEGTSHDVNITDEKIVIADKSNFPKLELQEEVEDKIIEDEAATLSEVAPFLGEKSIDGIYEGDGNDEVEISPSAESNNESEATMTSESENLEVSEESYINSKQEIDSKHDETKDEFLEDDTNTVDDTLERTIDVDLLDSTEDDNNIIFLEDNEDVKNETLEHRIQFDRSEVSSEGAGNSNLLEKGGDAEEPTNCTSANEESVHEEIEYTDTKFLTTEKGTISSESDEHNSEEELQSPFDNNVYSPEIKTGDELELTSESIENLSASKLDKAISSLTPEDIAKLSPEEAEIAVKQFIAQAEEEMMKELKLLEEEKNNEIEALQSEALYIEDSFFPLSEEELALMTEEELEDLNQLLTNAEIDVSSNQKSTESMVDENFEELKVSEANLDEALLSLGGGKVFTLPEEIAKLPAEEASRKVNEFVAMIEDDTKSKLESMEKEYNAQIEELTLQLINVEKRDDIDQDSNEIMEQINAYEEMIAQLVDEEGLNISIQDIIEGKAEEKLQQSIEARAEFSNKSNDEENDVASPTNTDELCYSSMSHNKDDCINELLSDYIKKNQEETSKALFDLEKIKNEEIATLKKQIELASVVGHSMATQKYIEDLNIQIEAFQDYMSKYLVHLHEEKLNAIREAEEYIEKKYRDQLNAFLLGESFQESHDNRSNEELI
ncbi:predicted protein [Chaetoceros tenuissimus]|uniref:Uncharacterized protein n=1 Tax=Chaetoceros tenuissimus TaxID=426638 RepID=A0AAD3CKT5_9STRA|nr:predicted protein [Chaetoceros tenuissimus]